MKKTLFLIAAAASVMLTGCTENDLSGDTSLAKETTSAIEFSAKTRSAGTTRAGATGVIVDRSVTGNKLGDTNYEFGVLAFLTGTTDWADAQTSFAPNFMYNQKVNYNSSDTKWEYTPLKYWPNGIDLANAENSPSNSATESGIQKISFFAYAPYVEVVANTGVPSSAASGITALTTNATKSAPKVTYKFANSGEPVVYDITAANNVDLLWGMRPAGTYDETDNDDNTIAADGYNTNLTKQSTAETVDFKFKHALAKLGGYDNASRIKVTADFDQNSESPKTIGSGSKDKYTLITLNSINIKAKNANEFPVDGVFNLATGLWESHTTHLAANTVLQHVEAYTVGTPNTQTAGINTDVWEKAVLTGLGYDKTDNRWEISDAAYAGVDATLKDVFVATDAISPFYVIPSSGNSNKVTITVQYTVRTFDENLAASEASGNEGTWSKVVQTITNDVTLPTLAPHKVYTIVLHLGLTSIKFSAIVDSYEEGTGTENVQEIWLPSNVVVTP